MFTEIQLIEKSLITFIKVAYYKVYRFSAVLRENLLTKNVPLFLLLNKLTMRYIFLRNYQRNFSCCSPVDSFRRFSLYTA